MMYVFQTNQIEFTMNNQSNCRLQRYSRQFVKQISILVALFPGSYRLLVETLFGIDTELLILSVSLSKPKKLRTASYECWTSYLTSAGRVTLASGTTSFI